MKNASNGTTSAWGHYGDLLAQGRRWVEEANHAWSSWKTELGTLEDRETPRSRRPALLGRSISGISWSSPNPVLLLSAIMIPWLIMKASSTRGVHDGEDDAVSTVIADAGLGIVSRGCDLPAASPRIEAAVRIASGGGRRFCRFDSDIQHVVSHRTSAQFEPFSLGRVIFS